ncbi:hypothetical protein P4E94_13335 [Pontiellaceae bacterium B12219]|nr:hypothetical protein [Pontiellaceae bacterium B12219]
MPADYRINLAKDLTSSVEERTRFYNRMLLYQVGCAALLVLVAYFSSVNLNSFLRNRLEAHQLLVTAAVVSDLDLETFKNPDTIYKELDVHSREIASLRQVLESRVQLLPVIHNLFLNLPADVSLQMLSANRYKLSFGLVMPPLSEHAGDPVRDLREAWEKNEELMMRVSSIRPLTGERRTIGNTSVFYVQFECLLKK